MDIAIITGASSGLGAEYTKTIIELFPHLDEIWLIARRKERLDEFVKIYPQTKIKPLSLDLSQEYSYDILNKILMEEKPNIKILINNAGCEKTGSFISMKKADIVSMIDLNIKGLTMVSNVCLPYMNPGSFSILTSSISSFCPVSNQAVYSASKIYVTFLSRALREENKKKGVNILVLCPGNMDTEMNPKGGTSQSDMVDRLPFLDMKTLTKKSILLAQKGKAIYTPGIFYKFYKFTTKILPTSFMIKIVGNSYK